MNTQAVGAGGATAATGGQQVGSLGKDDFLKLLLAQLRNQDPLKPMDDVQFIGQLTQFTMLEKMQAMDDRMAKLLEVEQFGEASRLIGKTVEASTGKAGETVGGIVTGARMVEGSPIIIIGDEMVKLEDVTSVMEDPSHQLMLGSALIGRTVEARSGSAGGTVKGVVEDVRMVDGYAYLSVGGESTRLADVLSVLESQGAQAVQLSSMIGKEVEARIAGTGESIQGIVESVKVLDGTAFLIIGNRSVTMAEVVSVAKGESVQP